MNKYPLKKRFKISYPEELITPTSANGTKTFEDPKPSCCDFEESKGEDVLVCPTCKTVFGVKRKDKGEYSTTYIHSVHPTSVTPPTSKPLRRQKQVKAGTCKSRNEESKHKKAQAVNKVYFKLAEIENIHKY